MPERSNWSDRVAAQLERVLASSKFKSSKRLCKFLTYVVAETLAGAKIIRSYNIAVEVFDKGEGFDPNDPYVRNIARHARRSLDQYYETSGKNDDIRIDVPAGNYIASFEECSKAAATHETGPARGVEEVTSGQYDVREANAHPADWSLPTIAIIPFRFHGPARSEEAVIGEIIAGSAITAVAQSPHFNVISKLSTSKLRNVDWTLDKISEQLGSNYVLSGSYHCEKDNLFLMAELADSTSGEVIWVEELRCCVTELLRHQDSVVDKLVTETARAVIVHEIKRASFQPIESLALHTRLVVAVHSMHSTSQKRFLQARDHLEHVLQSYPRHSTVNAQMAHWQVLELNRSGGWQRRGIEESKNEAIRYINRALDEDPYHALALTISGLVETQFNREPEKGLAIYNYAQQYHPNDPLLYTYKAAVLSYKGEGEQAVECAVKALRLSPFDPQLNMFHTCAAAAYYSINDFDNAEKHATRADALNPQHTSNLRTLVAIQVDLGKIKEAKKSAQRLLQNDPQFTTSSYLARSPNAGYHSGRVIAERLAQAGIPTR